MKPIERSYNLTDPALVLKCEDVVDSIDRDITEFTARGYTPAKKTAFEDAIAAFDGMPSDNYLLGQQEIKTAAKNTARTNCETKINAVLTAVVNVWGIESAQYHLFTENKPLSQLSDSDVLRFLEDFADSTEDHLSDLAGEGITMADVTSLRDLRVAYNTALKEQRKAIKNRDIGVSNRIKKGNELNKLLVNYCNTGKNIWLNVDEAKHNDYVIYDTPSGGGTLTSVVIEGDALMNTINDLDTSGFTVTPSTTVQVVVGLNELQWSAAPAPGPSMGPTVWHVFPGTQNKTNDAFRALTGANEVNTFYKVQCVGPMAGHYKITFNNVTIP